MRVAGPNCSRNAPRRTAPVRKPSAPAAVLNGHQREQHDDRQQTSWFHTQTSYGDYQASNPVASRRSCRARRVRRPPCPRAGRGALPPSAPGYFFIGPFFVAESRERRAGRAAVGEAACWFIAGFLPAGLMVTTLMLGSRRGSGSPKLLDGNSAALVKVTCRRHQPWPRRYDHGPWQLNSMTLMEEVTVRPRLPSDAPGCAACPATRRSRGR